MTVPVTPIAAAASAGAGAVTNLPSLPSLPSVPASAGTEAAGRGQDFGHAVTGALEDLAATQGHADDLALKAATGRLSDVHDYVIAATEASLATELTVAVRNRAVEAFQSIMQMPL